MRSTVWARAEGAPITTRRSEMASAAGRGQDIIRVTGVHLRLQSTNQECRLGSRDKTSRPRGAAGAAGPDEATAIATGDEISGRTKRVGTDTEETEHATRVRGSRDDLIDDGTSVDPTALREDSTFDRRLEHYTTTQHGPGELVAGRYRVLSEIGQGSMGRIFLAEQVSVGRRVA